MWGTTVIWSSPPATPTDPTGTSGDNVIWAGVITVLGWLGWGIATGF